MKDTADAMVIEHLAHTGALAEAGRVMELMAADTDDAELVAPDEVRRRLLDG